MLRRLWAIIKGIIFLAGLVGFITLPEDAEKWAEVMGPLADYVSLDRAEFALYAAIIVFGLWILLPGATAFLAEIRRFFKQHNNRRIEAESSHKTDQQPETIETNRFPKADLDDWRKVDPLMIWQAGCLWKGIKPQYPVTFDNPAYGTFSMLLRAAEHGELELIKKGPTPEFAHSQVTRRELARYAIQKRESPEFLTDVILNEKIENRKQDQGREGIREAASSVSALQMTVGESGPYCDTKGDVYDIKRTFNLKLENTDRNKSVSNCSVQILSVTPPTVYEGPWRIMEGLGLAAGDHVFIPLVTYGEAREPDKGTRGDTFITMGTENGRPHLDVGEKYTVALRATAPETSFCEFQCKVWVDENGRLRIEGD